jgi:hypothetical protein
MILQLNPPIPLSTPRGPGLAHLVIDYGAEFQTLWVVLLDNSEIWTFRNAEVRAVNNETMGRPGGTPPGWLVSSVEVERLRGLLKESQEANRRMAGSLNALEEKDRRKENK